MDDLVFESNSSSSTPSPSHKNRQQQAVTGTNAFSSVARDSKEALSGGSPNRKAMLNKKVDLIGSKPKVGTSSTSGKAAVTELSPQALAKNKDLQAVGGGQSRPLSDVKDLGVVGGKKRGSDQNDSQNIIHVNSTKEDSFQKLYSKELDLDEDEVPIILHELNDSAIHFISHEQYERSLSLLQKAQTLLDRLKFQKNPKDRFLIQVTMHNMALCFQKMGALEECALCLDACLHQINSQYLAPTFSKKPTKKLKKLKYECKIHMQVCALLSQLHRHEEALLHAKQAVQISQYLVNDLVSLCELNVEKTLVAKKNEQEVHEEQERQKIDGASLSQTSSQADLIYYDHSISMLERTALRVYPIIKEIQNRMVKHKDVTGIDKAPKQRDESPTNLLDQSLVDNQPLNMKVLLGYLNQSEWLYLLNIGNIMQITPLTIHDLYSNQKIDVELSRDSILEKITFLAISYFCVSTELRFLVSSKEKLSFDPVYVKAESEFWHGKALEISCGFLPSESPLVTHVLSSYQKHHAPVQQIIPENEEEDQGLRVIRPEKGIDKAQFQPIVRLNKHLNIALSPLRLSPNKHKQESLKGKKKKVEMKEAAVLVNLQPQQPAQPQVQVKQNKLIPTQSKAQIQQQKFTDEQSQLLIQAAGMHNVSKRSIEFSTEQKFDNNRTDQDKGNHSQPPDIIEYELTSIDQTDSQVQPNNQAVRNGNAQQQPQQQSNPQQRTQQQHRDQQVPNQSTTPNRQSDQGNKIQMAVPSPNALASAMQREQRDSLSQGSFQERPKSQLQQQDNTATKVQTQRHQKHQIERLGQDKPSSSSFQSLPLHEQKYVSESEQQRIHFQQLDDNDSIGEDELIKLATGGAQRSAQEQQQQQLQRMPVNNYLRNDSPEQPKPKPSSKQEQRNEQRQRENILPAKHIEKRPGEVQAVPHRSAHGSRNEQQKAISKTATAERQPHQITEFDENTPFHSDISHQQLPQTRIQANANTGQSHRSRSKGKVSKKKGALTQPQTHQNSANTTVYDPLKNAKDVSQFGQVPDKKQQIRPTMILEGAEEELSLQKNSRTASTKNGIKAQNQANSQSTKTGVSVRAHSSLENRSELNNNSNLNTRPPSSTAVKQERPDSRRMIGGKRRQIKDQQPQKPDMTAVRSSSAGRQQTQHQQHVNQAQIYKTNDPAVHNQTHQQQFTMKGQQANPQQLHVGNFKTFQQNRKAATAHSTQASNSPRQGMPSSKFTEGSNSLKGKPAATLSAVQDPVFVSQHQLNQSRSTIENNNSMLVDRSMNEQLMLNNSSFELGTQSRSRSFAKTGALSQQNSRDVIVGGSKKKNVAHPASQTVQSKSQGKQKANKDMLNYLNQGGAQAQKSLNNLIQAQNQSSKYQGANTHNNQLELDYRKQLLIKQALDNQNKEQRQKSGNAKGQTSQQQGKTQVNFQNHSNSVQTQIGVSHPGQVQVTKPQSRSSQGLRKSGQNINKEQGSMQGIHQSQKILPSQSATQTQQLNTLDPQALAAISQALTIKSGMGAQSQQNAQMLYNQLLQMNQTVNAGGSQGQSQGNVASSNAKKQQSTHTMIKKFLKDRAGPQQQNTMQQSQSAMLHQNTHVQPSRTGGHSQSPNPGTMHQHQAMQLKQTNPTLIDNYTQAPFLASSNNGLPSSKQAHTTKASAAQDNKQRNFNAQKLLYTGANSGVTSGKNPTSASAMKSSQAASSYFTEQPPNMAPRKGAAERFDKSKGGPALGGQEPGQREPTPVYHHVPYQKPDEMAMQANDPQYPMQHQAKSASSKQQLAAMYKSIKGDQSRP